MRLFVFAENAFQRCLIERREVKAHASFIENGVEIFGGMGVALFVDIFCCFADKFTLGDNCCHYAFSVAVCQKLLCLHRRGKGSFLWNSDVLPHMPVVVKDAARLTHLPFSSEDPSIFEIKKRAPPRLWDGGYRLHPPGPLKPG